jgi:tripartite-type tricarboxylate transporter receptor subunit TctC
MSFPRVCILALVLICPSVFAQPYPAKPIRIVVGFPPGGRTGSRRMFCPWGGDGEQAAGSWHRVIRVFAVALCALVSISASAAFAQPYPAKPIRIVVGFPPGGPTDYVARAIGQKFTEIWGKQIVVDNRGGAGSLIGTEIAARAAPDGYTLLLGTSTAFAIHPALGGKLAFDVNRDFAPITLVVINPQILVAHPSLGVGTVKELVAHAAAKPGQINYASVGNATPQHLGMEMLGAMTGVKMVHVPYKGTAPALTDLLAGQVSVMFNSIPTVLQHVKAGKLRALAVGSPKRSAAVPELPTVAEAGVPGFEYVTWYALYAPAGTPKAIVTQLNAATVALLREPETAQRFVTQGVEPSGTTPAELAQYQRVESERWRKLIKSMGLRLE